MTSARASQARLSERAEVIVEFPLARAPSKVELRSLVRQSFGLCRQRIGPLGRILGVVSTVVATKRETGQPVLLVRFAVEAPESAQLEMMG